MKSLEKLEFNRDYGRQRFTVFLWLVSMVVILLGYGSAEADQIFLADSVCEYSGTQGQNNWYYGYYDGDVPAPYSNADFEELPQYGPGGDGLPEWYTDIWYIARWVNWTALWNEGGHPNGLITSGGRLPVEHWAVRRWVSEVAGPIRITGTLNKSDDNGGDGTTGYILVDGVVVWSQYIAYNDSVGVSYNIDVDVNIGSLVDFAIAPGSSDWNDSTRFTAVIFGGGLAVDAGSYQSITWPDDTVSLDGTVIVPGGATVTTTWSKISGPGTVTFGNVGDVDTTAIFSEPGVYVLRLTADDGGQSVSDEVRVRVRVMEGLLVRYDFDCGLSDSSGNGRHGIGGGGEIVSGGKLVLDGSETSYVDIPLGAANPFDGVTNYTIGIKFATTSGNRLLLTSGKASNEICHRVGAGDYPIMFATQTDGTIYAGPWFVAAAWSGENVNYIDGDMHTTAILGTDPFNAVFDWYSDEVANPGGSSGPFATYLEDTSEHIVRIGGAADWDVWMPDMDIDLPGLGNFVGEIDYICIYDRILTPQEIAELPLANILPTVAIDIKPGSCPNPLNVASKGVLPVAILGSECFDVTSIDVVSIRLADVAPIRSSFEDVAAPVWDRQEECECTTEGPDGYLDLTLKFKTQDIVQALGEVVNGEEWVLTLTGALYDGTPIEGEDCIRVKKPKAKKPKKVK